MSIPSNLLPLSERINNHQAQLTRVTQALSPSGIDNDRVDIQASELSVSLRNQMQNIDVVNQANAVLGQADHFLTRAAELDVRAGNGALSASDLEVIRAERDSLTSRASDLLRDNEFGGQSTLNLASTIAPIDPAALRDSLATAASGNAGDLYTARASLAETRTTLAAEGNVFAAAASRTQAGEISVEATSPGEDLTSLLSRLQQSATDQQIAGRIHQINKLSEPDVLNLLLQ